MTRLSRQWARVKPLFEIRRHFKNPWLIVLMRLGLIKVPYFLYRMKKGSHQYSLLARPTTTSMADLYIMRDVLIKEAYADVLPLLPKRKIRFLDIGANLGSFTIWMHRQRGVSEAFCFEPEPDSFRLLNYNLALNECTTAKTIRCAIGGKSRQALLALKESAPGGTNLYAEYNKYADAKPVPIVAFQEWLQEVDGEFDLLKMDCECSEWEIVDNTDPSLFERFPIFLAEVHSDPVSNRPVGEFKKLVEDLGWHYPLGQPISRALYWGTSIRFRSANGTGRTNSQWYLGGTLLESSRCRKSDLDLMSAPVVSFIVPCYNGARYIAQLCRSIQAQTLGDFEVLLGDDGSTDNTIEVLQPFLRDRRFKLIQWKPNRGMHFGIVVLLNAARGQFWCPPGQDDILEPSFLERRVPCLASRPEAVLIHGPANWIDENDKPYLTENTQRALPALGRRLPESLPAERMLRILLQHDILIWPSTLVRADITRLVLPFYNPFWQWTLDWVLWIMLAATGYDFLYDPQPMIRYRMHSGSISGSPQRTQVRQIERKLAPLYALRTASLFSPLAKSIWIEQRRVLYRWWLPTALALRVKGALKNRDMQYAAEAYRGVLPDSTNLWRELLIHGLPALLQYRREKLANRRQLFQVSGLSLIDDPLFRSA